jgi:hypothetical protein
MRSPSCFKIFLVLCAVLTVMSLSRQTQASDVSYARIVRISLASGDVQISQPGHPSWAPAVANMPVTQGVTIGTNDGYAEIQFEDGTTAWVSRNTLVQFTELALADGGRITKLTLGQGTVSVLTSMRRGDNFSLATSSETIAVPKNAYFRVDAFKDGSSVSVLGGDVQVTSSAGTKTVPKGKTLAFESKLSNVSFTSNPKPDSWDHWTAARAQATEMQAEQASSYVNAPFIYGLGDLSGYGAWNYFAGYGYGWAPRGVGSCWMPFMNGDWGFYPGAGWTWVSAEPWGWMPYHFGSWDFIPGYGWNWFPSAFDFWNPAPVNWYSAGNEVGWWPMGFDDPTGLMYAEMAGGCGGGGALPYGVAGNVSAAARLFLRPNRGPMGHGGPRLMLTTNRLGHGYVSLSAFDGNDASKAPFLSEEPLENGKPSRIAFSASADVTRIVVPTAPDFAHLQRALVAAGANVSAMKLPSVKPTAPRETLRAVNAMPVSAMPSHRPSPMIVSRSSSGDASRAYLPQGGYYSGGAASSAAPARVSSSSAAPAHGSSGKPN